jgi:itaconate CoA-transferase
MFARSLRNLRTAAANLKDLSSTERAYKPIRLAHPEFRDELTEAARRHYLI